jgi:hypothetical protein
MALLVLCVAAKNGRKNTNAESAANCFIRNVCYLIGKVVKITGERIGWEEDLGRVKKWHESIIPKNGCEVNGILG